MIDSELKETITQITTIMEQSERATKTALESIKVFETNISKAKSNMEKFFTYMDSRKLRLNNMEKSIESLNELYSLFQTLDRDELIVQQGPQGSLDGYITHLESLKVFYKYSGTDNYLFQSRLRKLNKILIEGERILLDEFKNIIKHYSSQETMTSFINYLINLNNSNDQTIDLLDNNAQIKTLLFIPRETLKKLETICTWFSKKENNSELFNEKQQHCDIIEKLSYCGIRYEFIKLIIKYYLKLNSFNVENTNSILPTSLLSATSSALNSASSINPLAKINKFLHLNNAQNTNTYHSTNSNSFNGNTENFSATLPRTPVLRQKSKINAYNENSDNNNANINEIPNFARKHSVVQTSLDNIANEFRKFSSNNLTSLIIEESNKILFNRRTSVLDGNVSHQHHQQHKNHKSRSLESIELFNDNLNFALKLLRHEKMIINYIFQHSDDTQNELLADLTALILDEIQNEFEVFLTNGVDFRKISNNGPLVLESIVNLAVKIDLLKKNTDGLQINDLPSASKLIQFSSSLNEITAQILYYFLDTTKSGYFNTYLFPSDCSVHEYCEKICELMKLIKKNEAILDNAMYNICEDYIKKMQKNESYQSSVLGLYGNMDFVADIALDDEDDRAIDKPEEFAGRYRQRKSTLIDNNYQDNNPDDERKIQFARYFWLLIKRLNSFLINEALKSSATTTASVTNVSSTKQGIINLKAYIFLINNFEYVLQVATDLNLTDSFRIINNNYDKLVNENVQKNCDKACEIFQDIHLKWRTIEKHAEQNDKLYEALNSIPDDNKSDELEQDKPNYSKATHHSLLQKLSSSSASNPSLGSIDSIDADSGLNGFQRVKNASSAAKKAFKSFKKAVMVKPNKSDYSSKFEFDNDSGVNLNDNEKNDDNNLSLLKITKYGGSVSHLAPDFSLINITRSISELKKRRMTVIQQLITAIELSTKIVIINPNLNAHIKDMVKSYLNPMMDALDETGELKSISKKIFPNTNFNDDKSLKGQIFDEIFPNYKL